MNDIDKPFMMLPTHEKDILTDSAQSNKGDKDKAKERAHETSREARELAKSIVDMVLATNDAGKVVV